MGAATNKMDVHTMTAEKASEAAGWMLTSLGVVSATAIQEWTLAVGTALAGIVILGVNCVLRIKRGQADAATIDRENEIASLRHQIMKLHLKADEAAEQSRMNREKSIERAAALQSEIENTRGKLAVAEAKIEDIKSHSSMVIPIYPPKEESPQAGPPSSRE